MQQGKYYANIDKDPRLSVLPDEKLDLTTIDGYKKLSSQKTMISDKTATLKAVSKRVD